MVRVTNLHFEGTLSRQNLMFRNTRSQHRSLPPEGGHEHPDRDRDGAGEVPLAPHGEESRVGTGKGLEELGDL